MFRGCPVVFAAALAFSCAAADIIAEKCSEALILKGDQTGKTIRISPDYLPARWREATSIYAKGRPKFDCPAGLGVRSDGDGWWTVFRRDAARSYVWTGGGGDGKWETCANWKPDGVPGRLDTVKLCKDATIDLGRDRMVSNIVFSAKVILAKGAVHARNTIGRGVKAKLGVRAGSCLGQIKAMDGAVVQPLRGMAGYKGVLETDADGVARVALTRPSASYTWTGAAHDCKWTTLKNWLVKGRLPVEPPCEQDQAIFPLPKVSKGGIVKVKLPPGQTVVSNLVLKAKVHWEGWPEADILGSGSGSSLDVCDLLGTPKFEIIGKGITVCIRGATDVPVVAKKGVTLALSRHGQKPYRSVTLEQGVSLIPYDWPVKIDDFVLKGDNAICFAPPRHFNKWRPIWVVHAKHLQGEAVLTTDDRTHWRQNVEKWNDGSSMMTINWKD